MAQMKIVYTTSDKLDELSIVNGQIIFVADVRTIYMDMKNKRVPYSIIYSFATDEERLSFESLSKGFYFVEETNVLWRYSSNWTQLTPDNLQPIYFGEAVANFPKEGNNSTLYCGDNAIYKWNTSNKSYHLVANKNEWKEI